VKATTTLMVVTGIVAFLSNASTTVNESTKEVTNAPSVANESFDRSFDQCFDRCNVNGTCGENYDDERGGMCQVHTSGKRGVPGRLDCDAEYAPVNPPFG